MLVSDLKSRLEGVQERSIEATLGNLVVDDDASKVSVRDGHGSAEEFYLDEKVERSFAKYLGIPKAYLDKCDPEAKAWNLNHWFQRKANASAVIETVDGHFINVHKPGLIILPLRRVVDVISDTLDPSYEIVDLIRSDTRFQVDVITGHTVEVEPWSDIEDRNPVHHATVGDITHGGIRFRANPTEVEAPVVQTYLHRLVCTNGMITPEAEGAIKLKGNTVDEILLEMEAAMRHAVGDLDEKLASYAALANKYPPGSKEAFSRQLGQEYKIPARVLNKILDRIELLPDGSSLYDIMNVFTAMANEEGVKYQTIIKLQELGGAIAMDTERVIHRCGQCERLL